MKAAAPSLEAVDGPDPSWRLLYGIGGASALLYVIMIVVPLVVGWKLYRVSRRPGPAS